MGLFDLFKKRKPEDNQQAAETDKPRTEPKRKTDDFSALLANAHAELKEKKDSCYGLKPNEYKSFDQLLALSDKQKLAFILEAVKAKSALAKDRTSASEKHTETVHIGDAFMSHLLKTKLTLEESDLAQLYAAFCWNQKYGYEKNILHWPISLFVTQVERNTKGKPLSENIRTLLQELKEILTKATGYYQQKEQARLIERVDGMIFQSVNAEDAVKPVYFPGNDAFGKQANESIDALDPADREPWYQLVALTQKASGGKPTKKFLDSGKAISARIGPDRFKARMNDWFTFLIQLDETSKDNTYTYGGRSYTHTTVEYLHATNMDLIKGFVWLCCLFPDSALLHVLAKLGERCYEKIPGKGPAAASIGNACLYTLAHSGGLEGVGHLSRLKLKIKQSSTQTLIDNYLQEAAKEHNVTVHEVEDMAVDDHGLVGGRRDYAFDDYRATLEIINIGKTEINWFKPDGKPQKTVPAFVKEKYADGLKELKETAKQAEVNLTSQRDRLDRMFKAVRKIDGERFQTHYFEHGLMSYLAKRLIWNVETGGKTVAALYQDGQWMNVKREPVQIDFGAETSFSLWHPVQASIDAVTAWREFFLENQIVQPLKQAFREVYLLTDAEINTRTYSNRMAAHILKQHQFNSLAKTRGWKYSLLGAYDDGRESETASIALPDYGLSAEYWVSEVAADNAFNDTGIWLYVATDQVRFLRQDSGELVALIDVPPVALSEVMRDVDLFVGVASVGNDPAWRDNGGLPAYRDYWQSYSFGELTEVAKTRKQILQRLLPRLKIAAVSEIMDKFLVVKGKLRTYKIHLGSTNILMEPNDQYLCIVPDRGQKTANENVFLPFEGDNGLSIIISKAFLLADDEKITDETITRQIKIRR